MNTDNPQFPPLALALGRLRQPRAWPYAPRPAELAPAPQPAAAGHDFLRILPGHRAALETPEFTTAAIAAAGVPGAEAARTYWFDL